MAGRTLRMSCFVVAIATVIAGCFGPTSPENGEESNITQPEDPHTILISTVVEGTGYAEILNHTSGSNSFVTAATVDAGLRVLYAYFSDGTIASWDFADENHIVQTSWVISGTPCGYEGSIELLSNHIVAASCGSSLYAFNSTGSERFSLNFSELIWAFGFAEQANLAFAGLGMGETSRVEVRNLSTGSIEASLPVGTGEDGSRIMRLKPNSNGTLVGVDYAPGPTPYIYEIPPGTNRSFGPGWGAVGFSPNQESFWVVKSGGGQYDLGQLFYSIQSGLSSPLGSVDLENPPVHDARGRYVVFPGVETGEASFPSVLESTERFSDGTEKPWGEEKSILLTYNSAGDLVRGMGLPAPVATRYAVELVAVAFDGGGGTYAVTSFRTPLLGAQLWLTYGTSESSPPSLAWQNVTV